VTPEERDAYEARVASDIGTVIAQHGPGWQRSSSGKVLTVCENPRCDGAAFSSWAGFAHHLGIVVLEQAPPEAGANR
jgi:hypothetical protein